MSKPKKTEPCTIASLVELRPQLRQAGIDLLSRREHSRDELHSKLTRRFYGQIDDAIRLSFEPLLTDILDDFAQRGWQSDERFARSFLRTRFQRGQGPLRIQQELRQRRVADDIVRMTLADSDADWFELARAGAAKKLGVRGELAKIRLADQKEKARLYRFLGYRGFNPDQIQYALDACCEAHDEQDERWDW
ncbi:MULTISPECIES: regulatory protein RecX [unclassified Oceanobacter]|uniref:regulatory protein RecX n=2 Tax=Gammaproteobacteria TaxID=1236 RepID=UPI0027359332|nr:MULTISPECIES: regulatory protein RecX [unclassified Oceanobacter]MDP2507240.1 regulatory protein RecX [Oceanobacter sp. 3_MG-2023]MDP2549438.1 regulatory protein RecX [Oceanobacter sp. 4_MG-2023]MDP2610592.1 regulatory protein RecX [Oceanobacter sp. 1_MG-2023]MDP2612890.1 regulatory protein RecX [Oceanobacter sp. 2_MG-2023]